MVRRRGVLLVELLLALALAAFLGLAVVLLATSGARGTAHAGEVQLATLVAVKHVDEALALGYARLRAIAAAGLPTSVADPVAVDGVPLTIEVAVTALEEGLLEVSVAVSWPDRLARARDARQAVRLVRLVADPLSAVGGSVLP